MSDTPRASALDAVPRDAPRASEASTGWTPRSRLRSSLWWFCRHKPLGAIGGALVALMIVVAAGADWIAPITTATRSRAPT